jgi:hypothetical protein
MGARRKVARCRGIAGIAGSHMAPFHMAPFHISPIVRLL